MMQILTFILILITLPSLGRAQFCSARQEDITKLITQKRFIPPKVLYHFGKKQILLKNVAARTVPEADWNQFIIGGVNDIWDKPMYRRGLYGTDGLSMNDFGGEPDSWIIQVTLKEECRDPRGVFSEAVIAESLHPKVCREFFEDLDKTNQNKFCRDVAQKYLTENNAKIVQDAFVEMSFYIRDRSCIETIKGLPAEVLEFASQQQALWVDDCANPDFSREPGESAQTIGAYDLARIVSQALIEADVTEGTLMNLRAKLSSANPLFVLIVDGYQACRRHGSMNKFRDAVANIDPEFTAFKNLCI